MLKTIDYVSLQLCTGKYIIKKTNNNQENNNLMNY